MDGLILGLVWYVVFLFSTTCHEAAHAYLALRGGDPTAYHGGQVSLDPLPHLRREPFGMVLVPILSFLLGGWMIGWASTPYDMRWADRHPRRAAWMALAGPGANLVLVLVAGSLIRLGMAAGIFAAPNIVTFARVTAAETGSWGVAATLLSVLFTLNLLLFVFNLIPLPPLDGSGAVPLLLGEAWGRRWQGLFRRPGISMLGLVLAWQLFGTVFRPIHTLALNLLYPGGGYG